jgi:diaminobutyrate-2-oxoglutarate transaminase
VTRLPFPYDYRCPFRVGGERGAELSARWTENLLDDPKGGVRSPAGMIVEPVQGEGGVIPAPDGWLRRMRTVTAARGIPLIADEVQTGVGRTGAFWAVEHSGIVPDVLVMSKAIGGSLPLAVVVYRDDLDTWAPGAHAGTFRGNQLAMAAGAATLSFVRRNGLAQRAAVLGERMLGRLRAWAAHQPCIGDVRGRGLMIGVELVDAEAAEQGRADGRPLLGGGARTTAMTGGEAVVGAPDDGPGHAAAVGGLGGDGDFGRPGASDVAARSPARPAAPALAAAVQQECLHRGLIVELGGRHSSVVRLLPPLTLTDEQAEAILDRLVDAITAAAGRPDRRADTALPAPRTVPGTASGRPR